VANNVATVTTLLNGVKDYISPALYSAILQIAKDLYDLENQVNAPQAIGQLEEETATGDLSPVTGFTITLFENNIQLSWNPINADVNLYEIRLGLVWATATPLVITATLVANIDPIAREILTNTSYTFWIAAKDNSGNYGDPVSSSISIPDIGVPVITSTIIGNFALLNWTIPLSPFKLDHYKVYRNGVFYANVGGTFTAIFEIEGGTYEYTVQAVDIIGNVSSLATAVSLTLTDPPDYIERAAQTSTFTGTKNNCLLDLDVTKLIANFVLGRTWKQHFDDNAWTSPQAQVSVGYDRYLQPNTTTGYYEEVFDFGTIYTNNIINITWNFELVVGSVTVACQVSVSNDDISYDTPIVATSRLAVSARYAKVRLTFTGSPITDALIQIFNLRCVLNVHKEQDGGIITALAADVGGTVVTFNKAFKAIDSITLTPNSTIIKTAIYDFAFPANPTTFKVLVYDGAGIRIDGDVTWDARGVV